MSNLIKTLLKNPDISSHLSIKVDDKQLSYDLISSFVQINKPLNRNVWEYDEAFMTENGLTAETEEDKIHAVKVFESKKGPYAFKYKETDGNMRVMTKEEKDVYIHNNHADAFRLFALGKLHDSDEFHDLYNEWVKNLKNQFVEKYVDKDNLYD